MGLNEIYKSFFETAVKIERDTWCDKSVRRQIRQLIEETKQDIKIAKGTGQHEHTSKS